ncbi:MAG: ANTAR domain-containing protein [Spirochaetales bacterium]|nr:ANTAR domain-containing protein [Spirochaetales bacterium]
MKILIVSQTEKTAKAICDLVKKANSEACPFFCFSEAIARGMVLDEYYDLVIINSPLLDTNGFDLAHMIATTTQTQVLIIVKEEYFQFATTELQPVGVLAITKPIIFQYFEQMLYLTNFIKLKTDSLKRENFKLQNKLEEARIITKAKCLLVRTRNCSEEEAHHLLEKSAMNNRLSLKEVAMALLRRES